ncbi:MAG: hypothetical protein JWM11_4222 [Planctomycetaceae bacterium]|nr:hypothetical protein [Planctomycetaceae bacterium]
MPLIVAFIRPEHRAAVLESIDKLDACVVAQSQLCDGGTLVAPCRVEQIQKVDQLDACVVSLGPVANQRAPVTTGRQRGAEVRPDTPRLRLEVAVNEFLVDEIVEAIFYSAEMDLSTHDKTCRIVVLPLEEWREFPDRE